LRVKGAFQQTLETALILAFANLIFLVHRLTRSITQHASWRSSAPGEKAARSRGGWRKNGAVRSSHYAHALEDRRVGNQGALLIKISVRLKMRRKVYSWGGARRCTICDNVTVRSACRRNKKTSGTFVGTVRQDPGRKVFERPWWQQPARLSPSRERAPNKANYVSHPGERFNTLNKPAKPSGH
jgi:hypothetical protein